MMSGVSANPYAGSFFTRSESVSAPFTSTAGQRATQKIGTNSIHDELTLSPEVQAMMDRMAARTASAGRIFGDSAESFSKLERLLGMDTVGIDFQESLDLAINVESVDLASVLGNLLKQVGLEDTGKKITFCEDASGKIVVEGNIGARKKKQLAQLVNSDSNLVERIKLQKAKMQVAEEIGQDVFNLSDPKLEAAREQILRSFLDREGDVLLDDVAKKVDEATGETVVILRNSEGYEILNEKFSLLLEETPELQNELLHYLEAKNRPNSMSIEAKQAEALSIDSGDSEDNEPVRALLSLKRGQIFAASDEEPNFDNEIQELRNKINGFISQCGGARIVDYTIRFDENGIMIIDEVVTEGGDRKEAIAAQSELARLIGSSLRDDARAIVPGILAEHDDEHGDVTEYKHFVELNGRPLSSYRVVSPDADAAAMEELGSVVADAGEALRSLFGMTEGFLFGFDENGKLILDEKTLNGPQGKQHQKMLDQLNEWLASDETFEELEARGAISAEQKKVLEKLENLQEFLDKFHDPDLKKGGLVFVASK